MKSKSFVLSIFSVILLLTLAFFTTHESSSINNHQEKNQKMDSLYAQQPKLITYPFDIVSEDSLEIFSSTIKPNDTFYSILAEQAIPYVTIHEIVNRSKNIFNTRNLSVRSPYHIIKKADSTHTPVYFVYEISLREFVKIQLTDSIYAVRGLKKSEYREHVASGVIESSLYASLMEQDLDPELAYQIADVFAWQIDFYRIQKGDSYQFILEREFIDGKPTGESIIKAARFDHGGETFYAFRFDDNNRVRYFDEHGNSLQKTFLKAPLKYSRVSSAYSLRRFHPILKTYKAHLGTDYAAPEGTPVYAVADGIVEQAGYGRNNGNYVKIRHDSVYQTGYLHFSRIAPGIKKGKAVKQGQVIGYVGQTGLATGAHLCYRFWKNGKQVDPYKEYNPAAKPIENDLRVEFLAYMNHLKARLDSIHNREDASDLLALK